MPPQGTPSPAFRPPKAQPKMDNACFGMYAMVRGVGGTGDNLLKSVAQDSTKFVKKVK
jgi:hypothetical protein